MSADLKIRQSSGISLTHLAREPFRIFFPLAVLAGIAGVALWPLHFFGIVPWYPGQLHARMMAFGLFGGFIIGFLGTAMPRMLSADSLRLAEVSVLASLYGAMTILFATGNARAGDCLLLLLLIGLAACLLPRFRKRKDTPPPGFILVGLAFLCVVASAALAVAQHFRELDLFWINFQRLLAYQGFVLLPILGIAPFIMPRFFGLQSTHDFPEMLVPAPDWKKKALLAFTAGIVIIGSFIIEALAWFRVAYTIRFFAVATYVYLEMPFNRGPKAGNALGTSLRIAFLSLIGGFLAIAFFPVYRVGLLHLTLVGGFAVITFVVATRVVFGHSGNIERLKQKNRWVLISVGLMLFGMATRISGDLWPKVMASHYNYGAFLWIAGVLVWGAYVLPKVLVADPSE